MLIKAIDNTDKASPAMREPWRRLFLAIVIQAVADIHGPIPGDSIKAKQWLQEHGFEYLRAGGMDVSPVWFRDWVSRGCPDYRLMKFDV
jgi:hypothetical protein